MFELIFILGCLKTVSIYEEAGLNSQSMEICLPLLGLKSYNTTPNCMFGFGGRGNVELLKVGTFRGGARL